MRSYTSKHNIPETEEERQRERERETPKFNYDENTVVKISNNNNCSQRVNETGIQTEFHIENISGCTFSTF